MYIRHRKLACKCLIYILLVVFIKIIILCKLVLKFTENIYICICKKFVFCPLDYII